MKPKILVILGTTRIGRRGEKVAAWGSNPVGAAVAMAEAIKIAKPAAIGGDILASINAERKQNP